MCQPPQLRKPAPWNEGGERERESVCACVCVPLVLLLRGALADTPPWSCVSSPPAPPCCLPSQWMIVGHPQLILVPLSLTPHPWEFRVRFLCYQLPSAVTWHELF